MRDRSAETGVDIVRLTAEHWPAVERIYREGIATGQATFESAPPAEEHFFAGKVPGLSWVAVSDGQVLGWVAASPVSARAVYAGVVEHSVYIAAGARGRGVGRRLIEKWRDTILLERRSSIVGGA